MTKEITLDELIEKLKTGTTVISFKKLDGSTRVMNATLDPAVIPEAPDDTENKVAKSKSDKKTDCASCLGHQSRWMEIFLSRKPENN